MTNLLRHFRDLIIIALLILVTVLCGLHSMVQTVNDRESALDRHVAQCKCEVKNK